jgi:fructose-1,6-bisphosphatase/inositol monophosphatase family enzyme
MPRLTADQDTADPDSVHDAPGPADSVDRGMVAEVERVIRQVAAQEILPRFGTLSAAEISEKAPGDLVTVADHAAEKALAAQLTAILPGSLVVGEEAVATDSSLLRTLDGSAPVWIIDPIDGTHNFVSDSARFTTLVALARGGELVASWTYAPVLGTMAIATAGGGAFVDGEQVWVGASPAGLRYLDVSMPQQKWWTPEQRRRFHALGRHPVSISFFDTSAFEYIELASGRRTAMIVTWEYPWDHAAGLLLHAEAGGVSLNRSGTGFRLAGGNELPLVVAPDAATATLLQAALGD